jgi:hypothetical protein
MCDERSWTLSTQEPIRTKYEVNSNQHRADEWIMSAMALSEQERDRSQSLMRPRSTGRWGTDVEQGDEDRNGCGPLASHLRPYGRRKLAASHHQYTPLSRIQTHPTADESCPAGTPPQSALKGRRVDHFAAA